MVSLKGSQRQPVATAVSTGAAHPDERLEVTLVLRVTDAPTLQARTKDVIAGTAKPMSRSEYQASHASADSDVALISTFAQQHGLVVVSVQTEAHRVILSGTVTQMNAAFAVDLQTYTHAGGTYRGHSGSIQLPTELDGVVLAVLGLDNRMMAHPHFRAATLPGNVRWNSTRDYHYHPNTVASIYNFPAGDGHGETIAIIELGGGYRSVDLQNYFQNEISVAMPTVKAVSVSHGSNAPTGSIDGPDGEVMLDIEVAGAVAPKATIVVYFTSNTDAGFLNAITTAMHDTVNTPSIISISWGGPEDSWSTQSLTAFDAAFQQAAALGISVCAASGDDGSSDGDTDGKNHVDFPASSPHVLGCGGTRMQAANNIISSETVWNESSGGAGGGGFSSFFSSASYQTGLTFDGAAMTMRGVPDVAGNADPGTGYNVLVDGQDAIFGGTSAVAPLWSGLIARINSNLGKSIGMPHTLLYSHPQAFRDIVAGNNGAYSAGIGWDPASGLGSPNGSKVAALFT
jgi:kumamolisin